MKTRSIMHRIFVMILCFSIFLTNFNGMVLLAGEAAEPTPGVTDRVADDSTMDTYTDALKIADSTMNAGRVWADKSVFTGDVTLDNDTDGINNYTIRNDSDFMHVFSTIGSTMQTVPESIPLDLVFVLDFSASMGEVHNGGMRISHTIAAVNNAIDSIVEASPNSRIGIVVYSSKAKVLVPLAKFVPKSVSAKTDWLDCSQIGPSGYGPVTFSGNGRLALNESSWSDVKDLDATVNVASSVPTDIGYQTNLQAGLALGMNLLAEEEITKWHSEENDTTVTRIPAVIVMTDGQNNLLCESNGGNQANAWWDTDPKTEYNYIDEFNEGVVPLILSTLMTASYNTSRIYDNYYPDNGSVSAEGKHVYAYGISVDMQQNSEAEQKIHAILDAREYFNDDEMLHKSFDNYYFTNHYDENNKKAEDRITEAFELLDSWDGTGELKAGGLASTKEYNEQGEPNPIDVVLGGVDQTGFSIETLKKNVNFTDNFFDVASDEQDKVFNEIADNLIKLSIFRPVGGRNSHNDINRTDMLSYVDPIGKYMEVKSIKNVLLFGELYPVKESGAPVYFDKDGNQLDKSVADSGNYAYVQQNYQIRFNGDGEVKNLSYGPDHAYTFNLADIEIYTKTTWDFRDPDIENGNIRADTGSDQALYINIPAVAIPVQRATITLSQYGVIDEYETNLADKKYSTPLRVFYTVGVADSIKNEHGSIDLAKISPDYADEELHKDNNGNILLYSNWYNAKKDKYNGYANGVDGGYTFGDAVVTFTPNKANRYYLYQEYLPLYDAGGNMITSRSFSDDSVVYIETDYYTSEGENGSHIVERVPRKISEFGKDIGKASSGEYLCWYNPDTHDVEEDITRAPRPGYVLAAKVGGVSIGDLLQSIKSKDDTEITNTADTYYMPTISDSTSGKDVVINIYCGNNGRLAITDTQLLVTKTVDVIGADAEDIAGEAFEYTVRLNDRKYFGGTYSAIKVTSAGENNWRALIRSIDLLTNNQGLLLKEGGQLATYDNDQYYIYVGGVDELDHFTHTLFDSKADGSLNEWLDENGKADLTVGAYLIPKNTYDTATQNGGWTFNGAGKFDGAFVVGDIDANRKIGYEVKIDKYQSTTVYEYETLTFDSTGTAKFMLRGGEGILLIGIDPETEYTVTEILSEPQVNEKGILFRSLRHRTGKDSYDTTYDLNHKVNQNGSYYSFINENEHKYIAYGETEVDYRHEEHYCNFLPEAEKELIKPEREFVNVGDTVEYKIYWENYYYEVENNSAVYKPANVTITDPLDPGVDYVGAEFAYGVSGDVSYDEATHTVTWTITNAPAKSFGYVRLIVKVNENAAYAHDNVGNVTSKRDNKIENQARVTANDYATSTEKIETPVGEVHKTETEVQDSEGKKTRVSVREKNLVQEFDDEGNPGNFVGPMVGKEFIITYEISFVNYKTEKAKVTVTDRIDPDAVFYSASYNGVILSADSEPRLDTVEEGNVKISIGTVTENGTNFEEVTWEISNVPAGFEGKVTLQVKVSEDAYQFEEKPFVPDETDTGLRYVKLTGNDLDNSVLPEGEYLIVYNNLFLDNTIESFKSGQTTYENARIIGKSKEAILGGNSDDSFVMDHDDEIGDYIQIKGDLAENYPDSITWNIEHTSTHTAFYLKNKKSGNYLNATSRSDNNYQPGELSFTSNDVTWTNISGKLRTSSKVDFGYSTYLSINGFTSYNTNGLIANGFINALDFYKLEEDSSSGNTGNNPPPIIVEPEGTRVFKYHDITNQTILEPGRYVIVFDYNGQSKAIDNDITEDNIGNQRITGQSLDGLNGARITDNKQEIRVVPDKDEVIWTVTQGTTADGKKVFYLRNDEAYKQPYGEYSSFLRGMYVNSSEIMLIDESFATPCISVNSGVLIIRSSRDLFYSESYLGFSDSVQGCTMSASANNLAPLLFFKYDTDTTEEVITGGNGSGNTGGGSTDGNDQPKFPERPDYSKGDYKIHNTANVRVDEDNWQKTETMENPMAGDLTIGKVVDDPEGNPDTKTSFNFTIKMTGPKGFSPNDLDYPDGEIKWTYDKGYPDDSKDEVAYIGYFSLKSGDTVTIKHIPYGIEYEVVETVANGFDFQFVIVDGQTDRESTGSVAGKMVKTPSKMIYHNAKKGIIIQPPVNLPETGGIGTMPYYLFGCSLFIVGLIWIAIEERKRWYADI